MKNNWFKWMAFVFVATVIMTGCSETLPEPKPEDSTPPEQVEQSDEENENQTIQND